MVGAGGIGCELLKNLVLNGFGEIHVVDLDTIDLSNLNRQFLFRHEHIKKSKAMVAAEVAQKFNPRVKIVPHHANIKDAEFNLRWFRGFTLVLNALDNFEARRHVNRMCLAANVPLIESGTTGFKGQVQVIKKGVTACYDCTAKPVAKSFPVCTIRSTPSQPIHCIVWGKSYLLSEIFGQSEDESTYDHSADADNKEEIEELKKEAEALRLIRESLGTEAFPELLFNKVFNADIVRLLSMEDMWKSRRKPEPLDYATLMGKAAEALASKEEILRDDQRVWSLEENLAVFNDSLDRLSKRLLELKAAHQNASGPEPVITFDKDDEDTLDFVAAAANIRSSIFGIDGKSRFDIKEMAGNIIPAIATTNAIVAGLCVLQSFKVLKGDYNHTKELFLAPSNDRRLIEGTSFQPPNPSCPVCSVFQVSAFVDFTKATLKDLVEDFVKVELGYGDKEFAVSNEIGPLFDPEETENLPKKLSDLGVKADSFLTVTDEDDDDTFVNVVINLEESTNLAQDKPVKGLTIDQDPKIPRKPKTAAPAPETSVVNGSSNTNGKRPLEDKSEVSSSKRARSDDGGDVPEAKKAKISAATDDIILIEDDPSGDATILLDDD
ncbi:SUMO-activating enzyme subunit uba-2 [Verticillium dahliae VdLs.17]|uniref:Ubiquitin-activating enzyme E1-like n=2 Tax=Verticillium dahliae TaxID=27337 RepID=G2XBF1_VERDV|nr:SUMO-activating enzyme subunit uba-2 [Verticillium dahliae VdLs.17]EGY16319.1 SUMO-activating enzyme subunit uba-2 [Verticillium dahliae VdLs.17]